jgi:hypothetical protein
MAEEGHEERFPSPSLSGRCRLGEATFAGMGGKEEDAPIPAFRGGTIEPPESTLNRHSCLRQPMVGSTRKRTFAPIFALLRKSALDPNAARSAADV